MLLSTWVIYGVRGVPVGSTFWTGCGKGSVNDNSRWRQPCSHAASWKVHCPDGGRDRGRLRPVGRITDEQTLIVRSRLFSWARFDFKPNHIASMLLAFSCRRRELHYKLVSSAQVDKRWRSKSVCLSRQLSSAYKCDCTECRSNRSTGSSVYDMK